MTKLERKVRRQYRVKQVSTNQGTIFYIQKRKWIFVWENQGVYFGEDKTLSDIIDIVERLIVFNVCKIMDQQSSTSYHYPIHQGKSHDSF